MDTELYLSRFRSVFLSGEGLQVLWSEPQLDSHINLTVLGLYLETGCWNLDTGICT